jgi:Na+/proline symporter
MSSIDLLVLFGTLGFIVIYGVWKTRGNKNIEGYLLGGNTMKWGTIGLSVMATQASAITFLSTPGEAFENGLGFVQNYFGQPLALIIIAAVFIPIYYRLKVFTAYEYLEKRFDIKTRMLGASLFLVQRGLQAGITIYAPAIILSTIIGWDLSFTILLVGILVIIYTVSGGTKAVSLTQKYQMGIIMLGMFVAFFLIISYFPEEVSFMDSIRIAGKLGKLNAVDFSLDLSQRYTFWSGITGGLFMGMSYFGTDQSQVQRYLGGKNITESRIGLMFNALLKVPMQFFILLVGVMVFVFYQFVQPPLYFKQSEITNTIVTSDTYKDLEEKHINNFKEKRRELIDLSDSYTRGDQEMIYRHTLSAIQLNNDSKEIKKEVEELITSIEPEAETDDADYIFITFIMNYLPKGIIGLLIAVIFSAAMSSTSGELNALASTTVIDFYKRLIISEASDRHYLVVSKVITAVWGMIAISFAFIARQSENLIEAINIIGSLFYGSILGIFIAAFFIKSIRGTSIFIGALIAEAVVILLHFMTVYNIFQLGYLWYNAIGCTLAILIGWMIDRVSRKGNRTYVQRH